MVNKEDNIVIIGIDGTTKAAGHKLYDVKADHITVQGPNMNRRTFTTGYLENVFNKILKTQKLFAYSVFTIKILNR